MSDKNREQDERANNKCIDYRAVDCYLKLTYHNLQIIGRYFPPSPHHSSYKLCRPICVSFNGGGGCRCFCPKKKSDYIKKILS